MKKKYIDGSSIDPKWLLDYGVDVYRVDAPLKGVVSLMDVKDVAHKITVDYDNSDTCLVDAGYRCVVFLPEDKHWCVSCFFRPDLTCVEWYFDMTKVNETWAEKAYFLDLYLDVAVSGDYKITILDEDELMAALDQGIVTQEDVALAQASCKEVLDDYIKDPTFMEDFFRAQLKPLDP